MTTGIAWISTAPAHPSNLRPISPLLVDGDSKSFIEWHNRNLAGEPMPADCFPARLAFGRTASLRKAAMPDFFYGGSCFVVSAAAAAVMQKFDPGNGALYPVTLLQRDLQTPVDGGFFCLNFGNTRALLRPEQSPRMREGYIRMGGIKGWLAPFVPNDDDICLSAPVLDGPNIWLDNDVGRAFFLSDRLAAALKKAKANKGFFLSRCRIADAGPEA